MPTVGYASLQIVPSVRGIGAEIRDQLGAPVAAAGDEAGSGFASRVLKGSAVVIAAGAAGIGALLAKGLSGAMEQEKIGGKIGAQLGATGPDAQKYGQIAGRLYSKAVTEDIEGAAAAVRATMSAGLLPTGATEQQIQAIATKTHDLADTFEVDLGQAANSAGQMIKTGLVRDGAEALDVLTRGFQVMGPRADDLGDTFNEYSVIFQRLGLSATAATGLLSQGMKAGARDTDVVADALKEFTLEGVQGSQKITDGFKAIGLNADRMVRMISAGGPQATQALQMTLDQLRAMEDPVKRDAAAVNLFGTKSEDLQNSLLALNPATAVAALGDVTGAADRMGDSLRNNAATKVEQFTRGLEQRLTTVVGGTVLPLLERAGAAASEKFGPAFGAAGDWIRTTAVPAAADFAHAVADRLVPAATEGAAWLQDHLGPAAKTVGGFLREDLVPAAEKIGGKLAKEFGPAVSNVGNLLTGDLLPAVITAGTWMRDNLVPVLVDGSVWLGEHLVPAVALTASWLTGTLIPALISTATWLSDNRTEIAIGAAVITALLLPALITAAVGWVSTGTAAAASKWEQVSAWTMTKVAAVQGAAASVVASYQTVGGWIAAGASAVASGAQQVGAWIATGARAVWGMALQAAAAAEVVAGWVLMGIQSMVRAAQMAAAWVLAMGPVGWIITAVVALVALIIYNWDAVKNGTAAAWNWVWGLIKGVAGFIWDLFLSWSIVGLIIKHWDSIKSGTATAWNATLDFLRGIPGAIWNLFLNFSPVGLLIKHWDSIKSSAIEKFTDLVNWLRGLPASISGALGDLGSLLVGKGKDLITGLVSGVQSMGGWLKDKLISFAKSWIPGPIASALGINSPSRVMRDRVGRWIPAGIEEGIEDGRGSLARTMASLVQVPDVPLAKWTTPAAVAAPAYRAPLAAAAGVLPGGQPGGPLLNIESYYESESGGPQQTAMDLMVLTRGRGVPWPVS
ncbi:phage tail tape measure protein [Kitasatospora purpeofusca]|uniref:phage tail tape measure protein n=1 Tax=Kitasatospora purpeofusca TaxID=67352 RepID=UPI003810F9B3